MTTDRDAVERLAHHAEMLAAPLLPNGDLSALHRHHTETAATLRALLSERDHADAQLQAAVAEFREAAVKAAHHWWLMTPCERPDMLIADLALPPPKSALERAIEAARRKGFIVGFMSSGEGYNGEYVGSRFNYDCQAVAEADADEWLSRARSDAQNKGGR